MQRFSVATSKGFVHVSDFSSAMKVLQFEMERKREEIKKEAQQSQTSWDKEFSNLLDNYIPEDPIRAKYEGGEG